MNNVNVNVLITGNEWPQPGCDGFIERWDIAERGLVTGECCVKMFWRFITFWCLTRRIGDEHFTPISYQKKRPLPPLSYARVIEIDASKKVKQNFVASLTFQFNFYRVWTGTYQIICLLLLCNAGLGDDSTNTDTKEETLVRVSSVVTPNIAPGLSTRAWN